MFGASNSASGSGMFGGSQPAKPANFSFGSTSASNPSANGAFTFGGNTASKPTTSGFGNAGSGFSNPSAGFGNNVSGFGNSTSGFGAASAANSSSGNTASSGLFGGNPTNASNGSSLFGSNNNQNSSANGSLFGKQNTSTFGNNPSAGGGLFGQNNNAAQPASGGLFGTNTTAPSQAPAGGLLGSSNFNAQPSAGFGSTAAKPASGGLFGSSGTTQPAQASNGLFGGSASQQNQASGGGLFGASSSQQNQPSTGGLFGASSSQQNQPSTGGLFGASSSQQNQPSTGGLFGASSSQQNQPSTGGLFGASSSQQNQPSGGGLFGASSSQQNQPSGGGLFGGLSSQQNNASGGLFGGNNSQATQQSGGLFGNNTNSGGTSLFGKTQNQGQTQFNANTTNQGFGSQINSAQPSFGWSNSQQTASQNGNATSLHDKITASVQSAQNTTKYTPTINDQLAKLKDQWNPNSPKSALTSHIYNKYSEQEINYLLQQPRPQNESPEEWEKAMIARPSPLHYPVKITSFTEVAQRVEVQLEQVAKSRVLLNNIHEKSIQLSSQRDLDTTTRMMKAKVRHNKLSKRLLNVATTLAVLKLKGYPLLPEEEEMSKQFQTLNAKMTDPSGPGGNLSDLFARLAILKERSEELSSQLETSINNMNGGLSNIASDNSAVSEDSTNQTDQIIQSLTKILYKQQVGLSYLNDVVQQDLALVEKKS